MLLKRWEPFSELRRFENRMDRIWRGFGNRSFVDIPATERWSMPLDVVRDGEKITVNASLPGVKPEDIEVTIEEGLLTIKGHTETEHESEDTAHLMRERRSGSFYRALQLPDSVSTDKAESYYDNGVLSVVFPKAETKKAKQLKIKVGGQSKVIEGKKG